jgi:hypothetical protein
VLKFLNSRLPKSQLGKKKAVGFVTKKEIDIEDDIKAEKFNKPTRKILSEKLIRVDFDSSYSKLNKIVSRKNIKLPPIESEVSCGISE